MGVSLTPAALRHGPQVITPVVHLCTKSEHLQLNPFHGCEGVPKVQNDDHVPLIFDLLNPKSMGFDIILWYRAALRVVGNEK